VAAPYLGPFPNVLRLHLLKNRYASFVFDYNFFDFLNVLYQAFASDKESIRTFINISTTRILVVLFQCCENIGDIDVLAGKPVRLNGDFVLLYKSTEAAYFCNAGRT
jgi:hypothetical protein